MRRRYTFLYDKTNYYILNKSEQKMQFHQKLKVNF